jgi:glutathione S-transferase
VLRVQGSLPAAVDALQPSNAIAERLAEADPDNASWQRNLAQSASKVATILARQGQAAMQTRLSSRASSRKLREKSPDDSLLPKDLVRGSDRKVEEVTDRPTAATASASKGTSLGYPLGQGNEAFAVGHRWAS